MRMKAMKCDQNDYAAKFSTFGVYLVVGSS